VEIRIFDVEHGFCGLVVGGNGNVMLADCGHNADTSFQPADFLVGNGIKTIDLFVPLNYDEDHLSGLPKLREKVWVRAIQKNRTISPDWLRKLKRTGGPLGDGVQSLLGMLETYTTDIERIAFGDFEYRIYSNSYPTFEDTNNLSQVVFIRHQMVSLVFPGDLECPG
jgi:beta-lactamase superfamily II metal-dependent hydrolase